jgi:hypothetical protein
VSGAGFLTEKEVMGAGHCVCFRTAGRMGYRSLLPEKTKELLQNKLCRLRRIFIRECSSKIMSIAGYVIDF